MTEQFCISTNLNCSHSYNNGDCLRGLVTLYSDFTLLRYLYYRSRHLHVAGYDCFSRTRRISAKAQQQVILEHWFLHIWLRLPNPGEQKMGLLSGPCWIIHSYPLSTNTESTGFCYVWKFTMRKIQVNTKFNIFTNIFVTTLHMGTFIFKISRTYNIDVFYCLCLILQNIIQKQQEGSGQVSMSNCDITFILNCCRKRTIP